MIRFLKDTTIWIGRPSCEALDYHHYYDSEKARKGEEYDEDERHNYHLDFMNLWEGIHYERVFGWVNLAQYCKEISTILNDPRKSMEKSDIFMHYRYRQLRKLFPHDTFSVEQGEYNFFETTYNYLMGNEDIDEIAKSDYNNNYIDWVKHHMKLMTQK